MAAVGTRELTLVNERGISTWSIKLVIQTGTAVASAQSQPLGIAGNLQIISVVAPTLSELEYYLYLWNVDGIKLGFAEGLAHNRTIMIHAIDMLTNSAKHAGKGIPIMADDYITLDWVAPQSPSVEFTILLRGSST